MEAYIGTIVQFAGKFAPEGWVLCDGSELKLEGMNVPLFSIIGADYGGDGRTTFAVPNLNSGKPGMPVYIMCVSGTFASPGSAF